MLIVRDCSADVFEVVPRYVKGAKENVIIRMYQRFHSQLLLILAMRVEKQRTMIAHLYEEAAKLPNSTTVHRWRANGIIVNGPFRNHPFLIICHDGGVPKLLKPLSTDESKRLAAFSARVLRDSVFDPPESLVKWKTLSSLDNEYRGMLMPIYPCTLDDGAALETPERVLRAVEDLLIAIRYLHGYGFAHMDIKPSNIFVTETGSCVLGDLGSIALFGYKSASTPAFLPKDRRNMAASATVDWWMLALTVWDLAVGTATNRRLGGGAFDPDSQYFLRAFADSEAQRYIPESVLMAFLENLK